MSENKKTIIIRVAEEKWWHLDEKRQRERTTFQDLGLRFFSDWLQNKSINTGSLHDKMHFSGNKDQPLAEVDRRWVQALIGILQSGNEVAIRALKSNLIAFSDYVKAVPEATDGLADLIATKKRRASLKERMVDAPAIAAVGGHQVGSAGGGDPPKDAVRGGTRSGGTGKKVG